MLNASESSAARERDQELLELITRIAVGDQQALAVLYDRTSRLVYGVIRRVLTDAGASEEVLLDVYSQIWRQASSYDAVRGGPLAWMMMIARSRAIDRMRSGRQEAMRRQPLDDLGDSPALSASPEDMTVASEEQRLVRDALSALSDEQRQVIELAYFSGLSHAEIALRLSLPLGTVKTRARLAMVKLRDSLKPLMGNI